MQWLTEPDEYSGVMTADDLFRSFRRRLAIDSFSVDRFPVATRIASLGIVAILSGLLGGCSLLKFNLGGEPMPSRDLGLRLQTREFANAFSVRVTQVADDIAARTTSSEVRLNTIRWKLSATASVRQAAFGTEPMLALVDTWTFCRQMRDYFGKYAGEQSFGTTGSLATALAAEMESEISGIARRNLSSGEFERASAFIDGYSATNALTGLSFERDSAALPWRRDSGADSVPTVGNMPEAITDLSDRMTMMGQQVPMELRWRIDLERAEWEPFAEGMKKFSDGAESVFEAFPVLAENSKVLVENARQLTKATGDLTTTLAPELARFDRQWTTTLATFKTEREAVLEALRAERIEVIKSLDVQRESLTRDFARERAEIAVATDKMAQNAIDRAGQQLRGLIGTVLFYLVLILLIVLGLPFVFGYWVGKIAGRRAQSSGTGERE